MKGYKVAVRSFGRFAAFFGIKAFPLTEQNLLTFICFLSCSVRSGTVASYVSRLRIINRLFGFPDVQSAWILDWALRGIRRSLGDVRKTIREPLTLGQLLRIGDVVDRDSPRERAVWMGILIGFFGFVRIGNLCPDTVGQDHLDRVDVLDVSRKADSLIVVLRKTKTRQTGEPLVIQVSGMQTGAACPGEEFERYAEASSPPRDASRTLLGWWTGPADSRSWRPLLHREFNDSLRTLLSRAFPGIDVSQYAGHSCRIGGATCAYYAGVPMDSIRIQGDWRSDAVFLYIRQVELVGNTIGGCFRRVAAATVDVAPLLGDDTP
jgi:hypothetical protein